MRSSSSSNPSIFESELELELELELIDCDIDNIDELSESESGRFDEEDTTATSTNTNTSLFNSLPPMLLLPVVSGRHVIISPKPPPPPPLNSNTIPGLGRVGDLSELVKSEMMKDRFAKLLLGEDMSGQGNGVSTALAISNAINNLSASVFGDLCKLEPLAPQNKAMWRREMEWLLCATHSIVHLTPSLQQFHSHTAAATFEVMLTQPRSDLHLNLPALKKLDAMLLTILDAFQDSQFYYIHGGLTLDHNKTSSFSANPEIPQQHKWCLPFPKVPPTGLSQNARKQLNRSRECTNQILKAVIAINTNILADMETPSTYLESLPKSAKDCLGVVMYRYITADQFSPEYLLDCTDLSSEYTTVEIANRIEAAMHIWRQKYTKTRLVHSKSGKSSWGGKVKVFVGDVEKCKVLAQRAESLLRNLRFRFPGLPQTSLDMTKMQCNKDVGHSILESYSRVLESLAFNIIARIDDLLYVDDATKQRAAVELVSLYDQGRFNNLSHEQNLISNDSSFTTRQYSPSSSPLRVHPVCSRSEIPLRIPLTKMIYLKDSLDGALEKLTF